MALVAVASCERSTDPGDGPSPGGFSLLIERRNTVGQRSFYVMSIDGKTVKPFSGAPIDARALFPSPDGMTIAYLRDVEGGVELWAMDRDGANRRPLLSGGTVSVESAVWSPDGSTLAIGYSTATISNDIATLNADGTGLADLTPDPLPGVYIDRSPSWSPDGSQVAFSSNRSGTTRLWIMNADGTNPRQVLPQSFPSSEKQPVWAPDTTNIIAFVATTDAGSGIGVVRTDGTDFKLIPLTPAPNDPVWLPNGRLAYIANPSGNYDVWTVDPVSGTSAQLTTRLDDDVHATVITEVAPFAWLGLNEPVTYQINRPFAVDMTTADVLTDGRADLLILSPLLNEIRIMKATAGGALQSVGSLFAESDVSAMRAGIITADNAPDLIGRGDSAAYLWRGRVDGPGIATRIAMAGILRDVTVGDLDGNGRADLVSLVETTEGTPFRLKTHTIGAGDNIVFAADQLTNRTNGHSLCAGDMTGDGLVDIAVFTGTSTVSAYVAAGKGELTLDDLAFAGSGLSSDLEAIPYCADFNNDGKADVALFDLTTSGGVSVHPFKTSFGAGSRITTPANAIAIADIDRDGDLDFIMASSSTSEILVARNRGLGSFDTPVGYSIANMPVTVAVADLNADGWPDVMAIDVAGTLSVLLSKGRTGM
jgi:hypothetical protein